MQITETSLLNMLRHAWLFGVNAGIAAARKNSHSPPFEDYVDEREENIKDLIEEHKMDGKTCYNGYPCECK